MQYPSDLLMNKFSEEGGKDSTQFSSDLQIHHTYSEDEQSTFSVKQIQFCNFLDDNVEPPSKLQMEYLLEEQTVCVEIWKYCFGTFFGETLAGRCENLCIFFFGEQLDEHKWFL